MSSLSSAQAAQIREWLVEHGFRTVGPETGPHDDDAPEQWSRGVCGVRFTRQGGRFRVRLRSGYPGANWQDLDELADLQRAWPAETDLSITLATALKLDLYREGRSFRRAPGSQLYRAWKPWAHFVKVILQMVVGVGAVVDIGWHVYHHSIVHHHSLSIVHHSVSVPSPPTAKVTVIVIASALAVAAGIELAYTLFTPGPDEALDPLMLGLSSGILLLVTGDTGKRLSVAAQFSGVLLGVLALGALFLIRRYLIGRDEE